MDANLKSQTLELAHDLAQQATSLADVNNLLQLLMKSALEKMLNTELNVHLKQQKLEAETATTSSPKKSNRKNGTSPKMLQSEMGNLPLDIPRDREATFEPKVLPKRQRRLPGFDNKILALYAKGMTTRDIQDTVQQLYGVDVSPSLISEITADLDAEVKLWQQRQLAATYPIVFIDGIILHIRNDAGRVCEQTMHVAIGVNSAGKKELLGLWLNETEGAKFWLACLTDLKNRGLQHIYIVCADGLTGLPEAIKTAYPKTRVQLCVVHLIRAAMKYVSDADCSAVLADLKKVYQAITVQEAEEALQKFSQTWDAKYPTISKQWRAKWMHIITMFDMPLPIRKVIYTTNIIESVNSVIRKFTRNRKIYPNRDSALKLIFMAIHEAAKKWTQPIRDWKAALNHFAILFDLESPIKN